MMSATPRTRHRFSAGFERGDPFDVGRHQLERGVDSSGPECCYMAVGDLGRGQEAEVVGVVERPVAIGAGGSAGDVGNGSDDGFRFGRQRGPVVECGVDEPGVTPHVEHLLPGDGGDVLLVDQ